MAVLELNWWIVHRQRDRYAYPDLANALAQTSAALYNQQTPAFITYAHLWADAMRRCDEAGQHPTGTTETDWTRIEHALHQAWENLHGVVQPSQKRP